MDIVNRMVIIEFLFHQHPALSTYVMRGECAKKVEYAIHHISAVYWKNFALGEKSTGQNDLWGVQNENYG